MIKKLALLTLICCFSTSIYANEDADARRAILKLREQIKELNSRLDLIEEENKKIKAENEKIKFENKTIQTNLDDRRVTRDNPGYQELRDEINSINRMLFKLMNK